ncbi:protein kinase [uncultured Aureimonas sp.]|uniref:protein kinase domain-containing protein n=1 Tax=uncultured Aureimonas sp. TaxID=1604662 RepID=UPI0025D8FD17|nr:protein kinase [uncultured Aureimonas sp.]
MSNISRLQLNTNTRLDELQNFALNLHDKDRVRTERTAGGVVLYASPKPTGLAKAKEDIGNFFAKFTSPNRNRETRDAIAGVVNRAGPRADPAVFSSVRTALQSGLKGELKGASLKMMAAAVRADDGMRGPSPDKLTPGALGQAAGLMLGELESLRAPVGDTAPRFAKEPLVGGDPAQVGRHLALDFARTASQADKDSFVLTGAPAMREALEQLMVAALPGKPDAETLQGVKAAAETAVRSAAAALADGRKDAAGDITIGGKTYELDRHLGQGGFGSVDLYKEKGGTERIAVKSAIQATSPEARKEIRDEVAAHRAVSGSPNVVGLKGTVLGEDGSLLIAMEYAPMGDVGGLIRDMKEDATLTTVERRNIALTVLKDLATGMKHMHETSDLVHADFKPTNCFIGTGAVTKIADFGTATKTGDYSYGNAAIKNGGSNYTAPEYDRDGDAAYRAASRFKRADETSNNLLIDQNKIDNLANQVDERFRGKGLNGEQRRVLQEAVRRNVAMASQESGVDSTRHGKTGDVWALGATVFSLIYDRSPGQSANTAHKFRDFGLDLSQRAVDSTVADIGNRIDLVTPFLAGTSGDPQVDALLNGLLHPDPHQRLSMDAVLDHPAIRGLSPANETAARTRIAGLAA